MTNREWYQREYTAMSEECDYTAPIPGPGLTIQISSGKQSVDRFAQTAERLSSVVTAYREGYKTGAWHGWLWGVLGGVLFTVTVIVFRLWR